MSAENKAVSATSTRNPIDSSIIKSVSFENGILEVEFKKTGKVGRYANVPQVIFDELLKAPSKGVYFNAHIRKGKFDFTYVS